MQPTRVLDDLRHDVTFAIRQLRRSPGFTVLATLTLALGIGANTAMFSLVDATLLRPLPFRDSGRLVALREQSRDAGTSPVAPLNLHDWNERSRTLEMIAGYVDGVGAMAMQGADGVADSVTRQWVSAGFFDVLGVQPIAGRTFHPADDAQRANLIVISESFWRARFGGDPSIVGRAIRLDDTPYTVVGVVAQRFQLIGHTNVWALLSMGALPPQARAVYMLQTIGRMKPGATLASVRSDMDGVAAGLAREFPNTNSGRGVAIEPLHEALIGDDLRVTSLVFLAVVAFVLMICCANVANLLLTRTSGRQGELTIRSALGAGRGRVIRQLLAESCVLATLGGACGLAAGGAILKLAPSMFPDGLLPAAVTLTFDGRMVAFCAAATLFAAIGFGLAPVWQTPHAPIQSVSPRVTGTTRLGRVLVVGEVAAAVVVLFGAGLLLRTLMAVTNVDRGYRADQVLTLFVDPLSSKYPTPDALLQFFTNVEEQVAAVPGVRSVAWAGTLPLGESEGGRVSLGVVGEPVRREHERATADYQVVSPSYFATVDLPLLAGRGFDDRDRRTARPVCIINEAIARRYFKGRSPIGELIAVRAVSSQDPAVDREIVGVARQLKGRPDETDDLLQVYVPLSQQYLDDIHLLVRPVTGSGARLAGAVRAAIAGVDTEQLVTVNQAMTLEDVARQATARQRFRATLVVAFATLALLLAMTGVFGVLAQAVQRRVREFGVRRALGATTRDVLRPVLTEAAGLVSAGTVIGLGVAAATARLLATVLFGVQPLDPVTAAVVVIVLMVTATVAVAAPAWRAAHVDPGVVLRE